MMDDVLNRIREHNDVIGLVLNDERLLYKIENVTKKIVEAYKSGGKLVIFGNGGSASDAQHIAGELVSKFYLDRPMLNALALNVNSSIMTAIANDISYDDVFSRQVEHLVDYRDVVIGLSTSGNSTNIIKALQVAKNKGALAIGFTGRSGGRLKDYVNLLVNIPSDSTPRIQEAHILVGHIICELVERELFGRR